MHFPSPVRAALTALATLAAGCAPLADFVERTGNPVAEKPPPAGPAAVGFHRSLLVADLHADTLLWRRGLVARNPDGQVDLRRMAEGNLGLQVFSMPTRVPTGSGDCIHGGNLDPAPLLAMINGWPPATWGSAFERAVYQARMLRRTMPATIEGRTIVPTFIEVEHDLLRWLETRRGDAGFGRHHVALLLGLEGAHAFDEPDGQQFETLYRLGLRMVAPTHRFDNEYGGSSEGCEAGPLTPKGRRLIELAIERRMVVDLAHASHPAFEEAVSILTKARHPAVVSHSGLQSYLDGLGRHGGHRANTDRELVRLARTGGVFGVGFWPAAVGQAKVDNIVNTILRALEVLREEENVSRKDGGFHAVKRASEHVALGSDWDGAVKVAIDPADLAAITERLLARLDEVDVANIMGLNTCRVIVQSLGARTFDQAARSCSIAAPPPRTLARR